MHLWGGLHRISVKNRPPALFRKLELILNLNTIKQFHTHVYNRPFTKWVALSSNDMIFLLN